MQKGYKAGLIIIFLLLIVISIIATLSIFKKDDPKTKNTTNVISNIDKYGYTLDDRDSKYMQEEFASLRTILNKSEIDYNEYAKSLAKLFVIDFYTLNNKINKYDVGGLEYILSDKVSSFKLQAMDTIYNDIIDNTYKDRVQELPEITEVEILDVIKDNITLNESEDVEAYKVTMKYSYEKDLGYDKFGTVYLVLNNKKLEIALYEPKINE
ncbi:MAG: hypothetical protein NC483_05775 [Ruminococcus sp.]|nr:hypothetical protein [Ruminococcus sp.]